MIMPRQSHTCAMRGKDVFVFGGSMVTDRFNTLEFWNGIQWEIRMIPFQTSGSTLVSAGRTLYYLGTLSEEYLQLPSIKKEYLRRNASNYFNFWRMSDNMTFHAVSERVSVEPREFYSTLILPLSFLTGCDGIKHCIECCIYMYTY